MITNWEDSADRRGEAPTGTVLIVDDEWLIRWSLADKLEAAGYTVLEAADGRSALEQLRGGGAGIGVVLLDLRLPDVDGLQLLTWIKNQYPASQVILMTAFETPETAVEAARRGAYRLMTKPFNLDALVALVAIAWRALIVRIEPSRSTVWWAPPFSRPDLPVGHLLSPARALP